MKTKGYGVVACLWYGTAIDFSPEPVVMEIISERIEPLSVISAKDDKVKDVGGVWPQGRRGEGVDGFPESLIERSEVLQDEDEGGDKVKFFAQESPCNTVRREGDLQKVSHLEAAEVTRAKKLSRFLFSTVKCDFGKWRRSARL